MANSEKIITGYAENYERIKEKKPIQPSFKKEISENENHMREDSIVWKYFSKTGGIYDTLKKLESAVEKPAINAFDFDEEESTYIIFITVTNSILYLFKDFCVSMNKELNSETDESIKKEFELLDNECTKLTETHTNIQAKNSKIKKNYDTAMSKDTSNLEHVMERIKNIIITHFGESALDNRKIKDALKTILNELRNLQTNGNSSPISQILSSSSNRKKNVESQNENLKRDLEKKITELNNEWKEYCNQLVDYNKRKEIYDHKCDTLKSYEFKYDTLRKSIDGLYSLISEGGELYCLNNAPSWEDGTDAYMQAAKTLCEKAKEITKDYQF